MILRKRTRGFTLIELLVAIAIICLLAAILFPVFSQAKQAANKTAALEQAKYLGHALFMYLNDHNDYYPPSTNYALGDGNPAKIWPNLLLNYVSSQQAFVAVGTSGIYPQTFSDRSQMTIGYSSATAYDPTYGCDDSAANTQSCVAFNSVASFDNASEKDQTALFAVTPGGPESEKYLGYEFNPYNGIPDPEDPKLGPPLTSDRDLVKELGPFLPPHAIEPVYARYLATGRDSGQTFVIFADTHARCFSANQINGMHTGIYWRFR